MAISTLTLTQSLYTRSFRPTIFFSSSSSSSFSCLCSSSSDCEPKLSVKKRVFGVGLGFLASSILSLTPLDADATRIDYYATVGDPLCEYSYAKSGLGFCDLDVGFGDEAPRGVLVNIHYTARFADGTLFDSSYKRARPLTMRIGVGKVIRGLDQGILGGEGVPPMRVGGKRKLQIPPKLAYGPEPAGCFSGDCNIPGNATLLYDINFVEIYPGSNTR
ncbi:Photosynthetic NDH subunit of lumenal location 4 [Arabidopsis thaliana]|uniref:Photosynthetic NDH subunit of lumenal location 4, chloroplastic n=4 Tax=Arabidopsis TaxID=3701 RepID=PNSL4_ARATH|nr:FK506-binding protein 16-2 [Arabidopsis thaliana]NP_568067.1 FK506-binding protein 16-2 [Arabidopsis thaliana]Q9SCY3.1 RecName: Full=Photosynthetic NDH subunit of lumenal location 4, chloroplastic; AltName: Full=FK506-binding protein 16-2; Short=AtFKBP16-2; AltName: Full=Immunophilin FKBP16-2; AltName: Full=Peptidyl-prolyl cis-trans isomerase FKBP16-2; Short=PPIase FKBP16-2; AltName: Full=Rotamase; Flags: Precursor [Arabidopsis thaliana]7WFF_i Chain i, Photosynthetic NDH subunit of lumenal lo|eukprot:NP_001329278.1 FK506-binding protein 16-2 [Arabidopsis thaliana]